MKLFDRSVDLAKFRSNSSLYPVCRQWLDNDPAAAKNTRIEAVERSPSPLPDADEQVSGTLKFQDWHYVYLLCQ